MKQKLIVIAGPTATGKSDIAVRLAKKINGEIISADSMQVYKYMDIGTAKITESEMMGVKHYLIDELFPDEAFSVADFKRLAEKYISEIRQKSKTPIIVGGTGFYLNSVLYGNDFSAGEPDEAYRNYLYSLATDSGNGILHKMLSELDPESAASIHQNNVKRVVRALEYYRQTGRKISEHNADEKKREYKYDISMFILNTERDVLYKRIDKRVDAMLEAGLVHEVETLLSMGYTENLVSMQGIGYCEIVKYLTGGLSFTDAVAMIKRETRRFAKRQLTWFRNQTCGNWINIDETGNKDIIVNDINAMYSFMD